MVGRRKKHDPVWNSNPPQAPFIGQPLVEVLHLSDDEMEHVSHAIIVEVEDFEVVERPFTLSSKKERSASVSSGFTLSCCLMALSSSPTSLDASSVNDPDAADGGENGATMTRL
ncbi:hypothetical protein RJT34_01544 [Clitoria ternatea]|uniref:Uncharacterized protein n=1 Tax=Clitoria ternatea TaxID=43366 RepID=A0AAN9KKF1_CLITE